MKHASKAAPAIRIRMYRVGFGDCFLVSLPATGGVKHMLVDCGVHGKGDIKVKQGSGNVSLIQLAVENIATETDKKLAVVIATHQHQDHISGFVKEWFTDFQVKEVWMPWMDNPKDPKARKLKTKQAALVQRLSAHFAAAPGSPEALAAVENLAANANAIQLLQSAFNTGEAKYLKAGDEMTGPGGIEGLSVRVLAPSTDEKFLIKMDPPAGQRFLQLNGRSVNEVGAVLPFAAKWIDKSARPPELRCTEKQVKALTGAALDSLDGLALALDKVRNNTSLVVSMTFRGHHLLFPGDAQYGNWSSWIDGSDADELLGNVGFYKTAHHGSFNATPKTALERMPLGEFAAMVSTQNKPWDSIPLPKLIKALEKQTSNQLARSDSIAINAVEKPPMAAAGKLAKCFKAEKFWIDYLMPLKS